MTDRVPDRRLPTALLTNNGPLLLDALEHHELDEIRRRSDRHGFCFRYGVRKPDRGAYAAFAADVGVAMEEIAFVDDSEDNVDGARAAGLRAHLFDGDVAALEAFLAAQGLL